MRCIHYLWVADRVSDDRLPENIVRKKTNATKYPLARRKDAQAPLVDGQPCERQSGRKDATNEPSAYELLALLSLLSQSPFKTGIQKQNLTYQEKSVFSSILVCERPDFFKTRW